ncbi:hypothetical protein BBF96_13745 [Anoxybacter fermentans]|uniref:ABC-2 transporter permease n=1 Tax=Anoxybacter fermentans TaxID=1323375 RepID=A0A3Q9HS77_9FIRM|nr:ABC-2 transporter permease [Anoxybacter fermentans]AZR74357.1 hypothetical protein BBF96_13745 [Anoxybacter fermentans]
MLNIIKKDILFNKKFIIIAILYSLIFPIFLIIDGEEKYMFMNFLIPLVSTGIIIGKICYLEDCGDVRMYLKSLPIGRYKHVLSRYIEMLVILIASLIYLVIVQSFVTKDLSLSYIIKINIFIILLYTIYYSIYLMLFFTKNYYTAQNSLIFLVFGGLLVSLFLQKVLKVQIDVSSLLHGQYIIGLFFVTILSLIITFFISIKFNN